MLKVYPTQILPWNIGFSLTNKIINKLNSLLIENNWTIINNTHYCGHNNVIYCLKYKKILLTLDVYSDGIAVFSIHELPIKFNSLYDFDPVAVSDRKTKIHKQLLKFEHIASKKIKQTIADIRSIKKRSKTTSKDLGNYGLTYAFTFYFIKANTKTINSTSFLNKIKLLLCSVPISEASVNLYMDQLCTLENHIYNGIDNMSRIEIANFPYKKIYFSWSTSVYAGNIDFVQISYYCLVMRDLQKTWFSAYLTDKQLNEILNSFGYKPKLSDLLTLDNKVNCVNLEISKYTSISQSMANSLILRIYKVASDQSGMTTLADSIKNKLNFIRNELNTRIKKRNQNSQRRIEFVLLFLTIIQAYSAFVNSFDTISYLKFGLISLCFILLLFFSR